MGKTLFSDGNPLQGILGTIVNAVFLNKIFNHRHDGLDQDGSAPLDYAPDTGGANSYVIALAPVLTAHVAGLPIHFKATNANTGASTLAVNELAAVAIKQGDGSDLPAGAIVAGQMVTVIYTGAVYMMTSSRGNMIATLAEVQAGTDAIKSVTSSTLYNALGALATKAGFAVLLASSGYIKFPSWLGGLLFQWSMLVCNSSSNTIWTYPVVFPNAVKMLSATPAVSDSIGYANISTSPGLANTGFRSSGNYSVYLFAIGY